MNLNVNTIWESVVTLLRLNNEDVANTVTLIAIMLVFRFLTTRGIKGKQEVLNETRRRWMSIVQNSSVLLIGLGLIFIWSPELSTFALSLTAFAVAMVLATKEYILCMIGGLYRATSRPFTMGDWIEILGMRGEVIAEGILATKLQELGTGNYRYDYTGRILTVPNSVLLTQTVSNESYRKRYLHHRFSVTVEAGIDPTGILAGTLKLINAESAENSPVADRYWSMIRQRAQTELPSREPQVSVETTALGKIAFVVVIFCATSDANKLEASATAYILKAAAKLAKAKA